MPYRGMILFINAILIIIDWLIEYDIFPNKVHKSKKIVGFYKINHDTKFAQKPPRSSLFTKF